MKKIIFTISILLFSLISKAESITPKNWVTDNGNFFTDDEERILNKAISDYEKETSIEICILTIKSLNGQSIEEYSYKTFNQLGVGKKGADNGLMMVFSLNDRKSRIEVGNGLEPFFTDIDSHESLQIIKPFFRKGEYYQGTLNCLNSVKDVLGHDAFSNKVMWLKERKDKQDKIDQERKDKVLSVILKVIMVLIFLGISIFIIIQYKKRKEREEREKELIRIKEERERIEKERIDNLNNLIDIKYSKLKSVYIEKSDLNCTILNNSHRDLMDYIESSLSSISSLISQRDRISADNIHQNLEKAIVNVNNMTTKYYNLVSETQTKVNKCKDLSGYIKNAQKLNNDTLIIFNNYSEINRVNYIKYNDKFLVIQDMIELSNEISENLKNSNFDLAFKNLYKFEEIHNTIKNEYNSATELKSSLNSMVDAITDRHKTFKQLKSNILKYDGFYNVSDISKLESKLNEIDDKIECEQKLDYIVLGNELLVIYNEFNQLINSAKKDKEIHERKIREAIELELEEERRRRRNSYSSSSTSSSSYYGGSSFGGFDSSSSSSSDSSFGGFDGGSCSGGGSSGDW